MSSTTTSGRTTGPVRTQVPGTGTELRPEVGSTLPGAEDRAGRPLVLHVCTRYQRGGSERRIRDAMLAMPEYGHHLVVGADSDVALAQQQTPAWRVWALPSLVRPLSPRRDLAALASLRRSVRTGDYALVVSHQSKAGVLGRAAAVSCHLPAVHSLSMASFGPGYGRAENWVFPRLEAALGRRTAAFCVVGADLAQRFAAAGVPADRLHVARSGVPLPGGLRPRAEARRLLDERFGTAPGRPVICYVGSLDPRKNPLLLVDLLDRLRGRLPEAPQLLVLGDGPQREELRAALAGRGFAQDAVLTGHVSDPGAVHDAVRGSDVLVLLSQAEGLPQVLVQAAAVGTPYVAFDVEGVREVLALGALGTAVEPGRLDHAVTAVGSWLATRAEPREPVADLSSWAPEAITAAYRAALGTVVPLAAQPGGRLNTVR